MGKSGLLFDSVLYIFSLFIIGTYLFDIDIDFLFLTKEDMLTFHDTAAMSYWISFFSYYLYITIIITYLRLLVTYIEVCCAITFKVKNKIQIVCIIISKENVSTTENEATKTKIIDTYIIINAMYDVTVDGKLIMIDSEDLNINIKRTSLHE